MRILSIALALLALGSAAGAQPAGPYFTALSGISPGEGGAAPAFGAALGWQTGRRLGFEVEIGSVHRLDLSDDSRPFPASSAALFGRLSIPLPTIETTGRLLTYQTNAAISTGPVGRWTLNASAGGGVANLRRTTTMAFPTFDFDFSAIDLTSPVLLMPTRMEWTWTERRIAGSQSALCLNAGGSVAYAVTERFSIGLDARYLHAFFGEDGFDSGRVTGRAGWRF